MGKPQMFSTKIKVIKIPFVVPNQTTAGNILNALLSSICCCKWEGINVRPWNSMVKRRRENDKELCLVPRLGSSMQIQLFPSCFIL